MAEMKWTTIDGLEGIEAPEGTHRDPAQPLTGPSSTVQDKLKEQLKTLNQQAYKTLLGVSEIPSSKDGRHVELNVQREDLLIDNGTSKPYMDNTIRSSRYTFWSFFPLQLFAQFSKLANFYFLCVSIVQMIPSVSTTGRYTTLVPLLCFVAVSMAKEGLDDLRRSRLDKEENNSTVTVLRGARAIPAAKKPVSETTSLWAASRWQDIRVGDIIRIEGDQAVPADIALLHANGANGHGYIETMALDGETSLKRRRPPSTVARTCGQIDRLCSLRAELVIEEPNHDLYKFEGRISIADEVLPLTDENIIYRGSILRNTHDILGVVIYTGGECKIWMNAMKNPRVKAPMLQTVVNRLVFMMVCFVIALAIFNAAAYQIWQDKVENHSVYLSNAGVGFFQLLASFFLMFNAIIPLSLYISLEIVKGVQVGLMKDDIDMYDEQSDTPMEPRTSAINEDLGQVSYIFSDKTGTLTDNKMQFRKLSVAGTAWLHDPERRTKDSCQAQEGELLRDRGHEGKEAMPGKPIDLMCKGCLPAIEGNHPRRVTMGECCTGAPARKIDELLRRIQDNPHTNFGRQVRFFLLAIALCHTCRPEKGADGTTTSQGAFPDEVALVQAAQDLGYEVVDRQSDSITIRICSDGPDSSPVQETYEILDVLEFSSARRRMSIVLRMPDRRICVFCKGADVVLQHRLKLSAPVNEASVESHTRSRFETAAHNEQVDYVVEAALTANDNAEHQRCLQHVNNFASEGLRTLLYVYKYVADADFADWRRPYQEATTSLVNRQARIEEAADQLERDFELLGATAIEDKLQKGVPAAIEKLRLANIKLWMLTGDKQETAINISRSCGLINDSSTIIILNHEQNAIEQSIVAATADFHDKDIAHSVVVIDAQTLSIVEAQPTLRDLFLNLATLADSVICCRASPSQKATLVKCIRKKLPQAVTIAIGDGANDIAMIQEAHVGIGLTGKEGLQAARAADYSIAQFRYLPKLLLVHGRWNYVRTCLYTLGTFYKEMLLNLTQALYQRWNGYTGVSLYESWSLTMFQILFTCLPVIFIGIYEKDLAVSTLLAVPELYTIGQRNAGFNIRIFLQWVFMAASDAVIIFFFMLRLYGDATLTKDNGIYAMGTLTFTACVITISVKMQVLEVHNKTRMAVIAILFSVGSWSVWIIALSAAYTDNDIYRVRGGFLQRFGQDGLWWITLILILFAVFMWELALASFRRWIRPNDVEIFQEYEKDPEMQKRFQQAAA